MSDLSKALNAHAAAIEAIEQTFLAAMPAAQAEMKRLSGEVQKSRDVLAMLYEPYSNAALLDRNEAEYLRIDIQRLDEHIAQVSRAVDRYANCEIKLTNEREQRQRAAERDERQAQLDADVAAMSKG